ncbi:DUF4266 domain-containing protein [Nitrosomonas sp. Nm33]|uniref:DUF4266 domain-containing protein n=1 Tax=Nitrosomonas sp. Nm33 TaxID=133724 RepID=UPI00089A3502|nr:DUF4266 domain-containing protein [Nitrosomonas sp. Nm33]SDY04089.1 protein of unknown function [Nitrosomonas sp. Nm33]
MNITHFVVIFVILLSVPGLSGCVNVAPWERGNLAKPQMALDPNPLQSAIQAHVYGSREAAASINSSGGGGGCGCF